MFGDRQLNIDYCFKMGFFFENFEKEIKYKKKKANARRKLNTS